MANFGKAMQIYPANLKPASVNAGQLGSTSVAKSVTHLCISP